jgi:hypothetical protein
LPTRRSNDEVISEAANTFLGAAILVIDGKFTYRRKPMKRILFATIITALAIGPAMAQETCASKAVDKNGSRSLALRSTAS